MIGLSTTSDCSYATVVLMNPPLTPGTGSAPLLTVRVQPKHIAALDAEKGRSGKSRGEIVREALEVYLGMTLELDLDHRQAGAA